MRQFGIDKKPVVQMRYSSPWPWLRAIAISLLLWALVAQLLWWGLS